MYIRYITKLSEKEVAVFIFSRFKSKIETILT